MKCEHCGSEEPKLWSDYEKEFIWLPTYYYENNTVKTVTLCGDSQCTGEYISEELND